MHIKSKMNVKMGLLMRIDSTYKSSHVVQRTSIRYVLTSTCEIWANPSIQCAYLKCIRVNWCIAFVTSVSSNTAIM